MFSLPLILFQTPRYPVEIVEQRTLSKSTPIFEKVLKLQSKCKGLSNLSVQPFVHNAITAAKITLTFSFNEGEEEGEEKETIVQALKQFSNELDEILTEILTDPKSCPKLSLTSLTDTLGLANQCQNIVNYLKGLENVDLNHRHLQALREQIDQALNSPAYQNRKTSNHDLNWIFCRFLQALSYQINTQPDGLSIYDQVGQEAVQKYGNETMSLAQLINTAFAKVPRNTQGLLWGLKHLLEVIAAFLDNRLKFGHHFYNSNAQGNFNAAFGDILVHGKRIRIYHGASPMNDSLFEAQLEWEKYLGIHHVQHTLEFNKEKGENHRLNAMHSLTKSHDNYDLMATLLNGDPWEAKGKFSQIKSVEDYHQNLKELIRTEFNLQSYTGFALPLLDKDEIQQAINHSQSAFQALLKDVDLKNLDHDQVKRLSRAMVLGISGFLVIQSLMKLEEKKLRLKSAKIDPAVPDATLGQMCKQGADRGPMINDATMAYCRLIEKGTLDKTDHNRILGLLLARASSADERLMVESRRVAVQDLFSLIEKNETAFAFQLQHLVGKSAGKPSPIQFVPIPASSLSRSR